MCAGPTGPRRPRRASRRHAGTRPGRGSPWSDCRLSERKGEFPARSQRAGQDHCGGLIVRAGASRPDRPCARSERQKLTRSGDQSSRARADRRCGKRLARSQGGVPPEATVGFRSERGNSPPAASGPARTIAIASSERQALVRPAHAALARKGRNSLASVAGPPAPVRVVTLPPTRTHARPGFLSERLSIFGAKGGNSPPAASGPAWAIAPPPAFKRAPAVNAAATATAGRSACPRCGFRSTASAAAPSPGPWSRFAGPPSPLRLPAPAPTSCVHRRSASRGRG
jgi:hypothetical protein